jgi:hypothetical protein
VVEHRGRRRDRGGVAGPLAVVALKDRHPFAALWAGVAAVVVTGETWQMGADAGPSLVLLAVRGWLAARWLRSLRPEEGTFLRPGPWDG